MKAFFANWKTTAAGILAAVATTAAYGAKGKWLALALAVLGLLSKDANTGAAGPAAK
jgi:hypothetical protein